MQQPSTVYLIDGSGYIFRAFYAIAPLSTKAGFPTNALFGFVRMLMRLLKDSSLTHAVVAFDSGRETFRTEIYPQYKANRSEPPEELKAQFPYFRDLARALGFPIIEQKGFEADDLIATLAESIRKAGSEVVIVSADKDLMQLVGQGISMWDTMKDQRYGPAEVVAKLGVPPEKVIDLLALMGDSSDNVPGLDGVGPKTAVQLIERYGSVQNILDSADAIRGDAAIRNRTKVADAVRDHAEILRVSRTLVECRRDLEVTLQGVKGPVSVHGQTVDDRESKAEFFAALAYHTPEAVALQDVAERFDFYALMNEIAPRVAASATSGAAAITVWADDLDRVLADVAKADIVAIDLETTSLSVLEAQIVGLSLCISAECAWYIPLSHEQIPADKHQADCAALVARVARILNRPGVVTVGQNLKYDLGVLAQHGAMISGQLFDTMLGAYLIDPDAPSFNLTALAANYLQRAIIEYTDIVPKGTSFAAVEIDVATRYGCQDAQYAFDLYGVLRPRLEERHLLGVFHDIETPLVPIVSAMERAGILLDTKLLSALSMDAEQKLAVLRQELCVLAGSEINLNSPKQLSEVLFTKLQLPTRGLKRTKTGISTDSGVLEKLAPLHPLPAKILEYRAIYKLKSTYIDTLPLQVSAIDGRLHTSFNQTGTATGRLSSSEPNLQNIPIATEAGRAIRKAFVAPPGWVLMSADYSQIELRMLAHLSGDENLISAFVNDQDIHAMTAREILGIMSGFPLTPEQRRIGKTINFGIVYGMGPYRLSQDLAIPLAVAREYIEGYFARFPKVQGYFTELEKAAERDGYVSTLFGRRRMLGSIDTSERDQGFLRRVAMNAPLQGSAADIVKLAMIRVNRALGAERLQGRLLLQIHDELVFEVPEEEVVRVLDVVRRAMEGVCVLKVPLKVEIGHGLNWDQAHG